MKQRVSKQILSALTALVMIMGILPLPAMIPASAETSIVNAYSAEDVLNGLTTKGDVTITLEKDINIQVDETYEWGYDSFVNRWVWVTVADGFKELRLNGHTLAVDDALVDTAKYITEKQYNTETGQIEEVDVFVANAFRQKAALICIPENAKLYVNAENGGKVMMTAKIPDNKQMMDNRIVMQRDVFLVRGGYLATKGGTYQAGRRKDLYVNKAIKCDENWHYQLNVFYETTHYWGYGEYAVNGTAVFAVSGRVSIYGGTFIGHGYEINNRDYRNGVFELSNACRLWFCDGNVQGYSGADCFDITESCSATLYSGWTKTYAPDRFLWPRGAERVNADDSYCLAVDVGQGDASFPTNKAERTEESANGGILYAPESSVTVDGLRWISGSASQSAYAIGETKKVVFDIGELYYDSYATGNEMHNVDYLFSLSERQTDGKWKSVTGWVTNGSDDTVDLLTFADYMSPGGTYRLSAKATERWSSTHDFTRTVTAEKHVSFTTDTLVLKEVALRIEDPVEGELLALTDDVDCLTGGYTVESIRWSSGSDTYPADDFVTAVSGKTYKAVVTLRIRTGVALGSSVSAKVNAAPAAISISGNTIVVTYTFPVTEKVIRNVKFSIAAPYAEKAPSYAVKIPESKHFTNTEVRWYYEEGYNYVQMNASSCFEYGRRYVAEIDIAAKNGYEFAVDASGMSVLPGIYAEVNGIECDVKKIYDEAPQDAVTVVCYFDLLSAEDLIKTAKVIVIDTPYPGNTPDYSAYADGEGYTVDYEENNDTTVNGVFWSYRKNGETILLTPEDTFKAGVEYTVNVILATTGSHRFALGANGEPLVSAAVAGNDASVDIYGEEPAGRICVSYTFPWKVIDVSDVVVFDLTLPLPGAHPDYQPSLGNDELYEIKNIQWYQGDYQSGTPIYQEDIFAPSDFYAVEIRISRKMAGSLVISRFVSPVNVYFNGYEADFAEVMSNATDVYIYINFATDGVAVIYGDVNDDGAVNKKDSLALKKYLADNTNRIDLTAADVNADGAVNKKDSLRLKQYLAGWDVVLGA